MLVLDSVTEKIVFTIIARAGEARAELFSAFDSLKVRDITGAREKVEKAGSLLSEVHDVHGQLLQREAQGDSVTVSLLLAHAEDILMAVSSELALVEKIVDLVAELVK